MSYSDEEVSRLKILLQDVLEDNFLNKFLEMREKLTKSQQILKDLMDRVEYFENELKFYHDCEDCKRINKIQHHAATQTTDSGKSIASGDTRKSENHVIDIDEPQSKKESRPEDTGRAINNGLTMKRPRREEGQIQQNEIPIITID